MVATPTATLNVGMVLKAPMRNVILEPTTPTKRLLVAELPAKIPSVVTVSWISVNNVTTEPRTQTPLLMLAELLVFFPPVVMA